MDLSQFIGFLISTGALIFIFLQRILESKNREKHPEKYIAKEKKRQDAMRELLKELNIEITDEDEDEEEVQASPPPPFHHKTSLQRDEIPRWKTKPSKPLSPSSSGYAQPLSSLDSRYLDQQNDAYMIRKKSTISRGALLITPRQKSLRNAVILRELLDKPKAFQYEHD